MAFDPFNDFETRGYLRNHTGTKDPDIVRRLEHNAFAGNIGRALQSLRDAKQIDLESVQQTHRILFSDVYPWAGQDRSKNAADLNITKGEIEFQLAPYVPRGVEHALQTANDPTAFRSDPGKVIGELAYAHPFLDGNGRTITAVVSELSRRAGFHIVWEDTDKQNYLKALTKELGEPDKGHLTSYLKPFIREGALGIEHSSATLTTLPGLSAPDNQLTETTEAKPVLTIVAGPNGAGKSSLTATGIFGNQPVVDPDAIARSLNPQDPDSVGARAGKRALDLRNDYLYKGQSFVVETTLSGNSALALMNEAKDHGFRIELNYIGLDNDKLASARVAARVAAGGHNIPQEDLERRFIRSMENLPDAISRADQTDLYDNSGKQPLKLVASLDRENYRFHEPPKWATDAAFSAAQNDLSKAQSVPELERATQRAFDAARAAGVSDGQLSAEVRKIERVQKRKMSREGHDL